MAQADKQRWDEKHQKNMMPQEPIKLLQEYVHLATGKQALDIACGNGRHSKYLVSHGFKVDALDISSVAIEQLQNMEHVTAKEVDFDTYHLEQNKYDLIICTYFLERRLFPQMIEALKPHGVLLIETFLHHNDNERIPSNPAFRLDAGELKLTFANTCELIHIKEFWDTDYQGFKTMKTAMVARKKI